MPYFTPDKLPEKIRKVLPLPAQKIYVKSFDNAINEYQNPEKRRGNDKTKASADTVAHKVAWAAVKKKYKKDVAGYWVKK